jgi:ABC-2 type transport system permease protein/sodium transport system permease protein
MSALTPSTAASIQGTGLSLSRLARLTLKELRETLRDRRTILTLVLMPVLVYPLLNLAFRQFLVTGVPDPHAGRVRIGVATEEEHQLLQEFLKLGDGLLQQQASRPGPDSPPAGGIPPPTELSSDSFHFYSSRSDSQPIQDLPVDLAVRIEPAQPAADGQPVAPTFTFRIWYLPQSPISCQAARHIEQRLRAVNEDQLRIWADEQAGQRADR